ncbi:molybdenum cofactor biosynthesis protein MoaE [Eikenella sp. S3360]|uniref:Molybdopterin synthase catalytic subunit n=1 Tax=Eikenella glucosivorans TaxID=2766967 RepID=A0ABS0N8A7_9NEIS|nr:molybdenum cofactor biosynthesis protein MoaE [Eikenella glucosivorans]MBH5328494.1 molybdenum cofactor biosynthesis protein MoaE [Eikenella glucosivorans]
MFDLTEQAIDSQALRQRLLDNEQCGAFLSFEGWVRRQNDGRRVDYLVYRVYEELARRQGQAVIEEAKRRFGLAEAVCVHRHGRLEVGDMAVWVGVTAGHRDAAFAGCRFIIDTVKAEVPIWKQEFYSDSVISAWPDNQTADAKRRQF